ncbi:Poly(A) polymerase [Mycena sanguinolenta]|uniref:polynucleotide adenylyltransferase n=1 Tax=Mycena sanguinolenta TaxID=230812 RepID=A0A8H6XJP0_9AGAR|nr:Poly(A) polymerase [Mycena sanguinolenta]
MVTLGMISKDDSDSQSIRNPIRESMPISTVEPNEREKEATISLGEELRRQNVLETADEIRMRETVLNHVDSLMKHFVVSIGENTRRAAAAASKLLMFGSYRLGHVSKDEFFDAFESMLLESQSVSEVTCIRDAYVPTIKTKICGMSIDLAMAWLEPSSILDDLFVRDDMSPQNENEQYVRILGGSLVTEDMLRLVPNIQVFRDSLQCIGLWAQRRAIYSDLSGFLGGIAWATVVCRICQLYPNAVSSTIVRHAFIMINQWCLKFVSLLLPGRMFFLSQAHPASWSHRMPTITPGYPAISYAHNVASSTQIIMTDEIKRANDIVEQAIAGKTSWSELFAKDDFFHAYEHYVQVIACTGDKDLQIQWYTVTTSLEINI